MHHQLQETIEDAWDQREQINYETRGSVRDVRYSGTLGGGQREDGSQVPNLYCAVIIKQVDARTRSKTSINDLLRD